MNVETLNKTLNAMGSVANRISASFANIPITTPKESHHHPWTPEVIGWVGLSVVVVISLLIAYSTILCLKNRNRKSIPVVFVCGLALMFAIMLTLIMPIDVFVVSYMKDLDGHFKPWVNDDTILYIQKVITIVYFWLYGTLATFVFGILPFFYFLYDGCDYDDEETTSKRLCRAGFATAGTMLVLVIICLCGAFIPLKETNSNGTTAHYKSLISTLPPKLISIAGFVYSSMAIAGIITACFYTAYGLAHTPMALLQCRGLLAGRESRQLLIESSRKPNITTMNTANLKSEFARYAVAEHQAQMDVQVSDEPSSPIHEEVGCLKRTANILILYPFKLLFGLIALFISGLLIVSLSTVCVDKWKNSSYSMGYALNISSIVNPADFIITKSQQFFPLDYTIFAMMFATLLVSSIYSIKCLGIRILLVKLYIVTPGRSSSQGLLCFTLFMLVICLSFSSLLFNILPTYMTYGHQIYVDKQNKLVMCDSSQKECVETIVAQILKTFILKVNFFGSIIFYSFNLFLVCYVVGIFVSVYRVFFMKKHDDNFTASTSQNILNDDDDDDDILIA